MPIPTACPPLLPRAADEAPTRVAALADDHRAALQLVQRLSVDRRLQTGGALDQVLAARRWFAQDDADVLLIDRRCIDPELLEWVRWLARERPHCGILVVVEPGDESAALELLEAGAMGCVTRDTPGDALADAVVEVRRGASPLCPRLARRLLQRYRCLKGQETGPAQPCEAATDDGIRLSPREREVLGLIARGYAYAEMAGLLGLTVHTIQSHIKNLYGKLGVHSRSEAVFEASRAGLVPGWGA